MAQEHIISGLQYSQIVYWHRVAKTAKNVNCGQHSDQIPARKINIVNQSLPLELSQSRTLFIWANGTQLWFR